MPIPVGARGHVYYQQNVQSFLRNTWKKCCSDRFKLELGLIRQWVSMSEYREKQDALRGRSGRSEKGLSDACGSVEIPIRAGNDYSDDRYQDNL
jgi:hypothetical protein